MNYSSLDILSFVEQNDVKFIRLAFSDIFGRMKNIAILPTELKKAFEYGMPIDVSAYLGKDYVTGHELRLFPIASTLTSMPWRPKTGSVIRLLCDIKELDGSTFELDQRSRLVDYYNYLSKLGYCCDAGTECEFYLFERDNDGQPTHKPHDYANYLDTSPLDKCENIRREICISLEEMGLSPKTSRHKYGPGQNEIDFTNADIVSCADNFNQFKVAVKTIAYQNGLFCSFLPKPILDKTGSALIVTMNILKDGNRIFSLDKEGSMNSCGEHFIAGVLNRLPEMSCFLNANTNSYDRLNQIKKDNSMPNLIRIQPDKTSQRIAICSPDPMCNIYSVLNLIMHAGIEGIEHNTLLKDVKCKDFSSLPSSFEEALSIANDSEFVHNVVGSKAMQSLQDSLGEIVREYNLTDDKSAFNYNTYLKYYG